MASTLVQRPVLDSVERSREVTRRLLGCADRWRHEVRPLAEDRSYTRLLDLPDADAWLILWSPGSGLELHDHGGSSATIAVVQGLLTEHHRPRVGGPLRQRLLATGDTVSFGPDHLHAVENTGLITAASIHVYSPPLERMDFPDAGLRLDPSAAEWQDRAPGTVRP